MTEPTPLPSVPKGVDALAAPILFFDGCAFVMANNGVLGVTLVAGIQRPGSSDQPIMESVSVVHLRSNRGGMIALHNAIAKALLLGTPTQGGQN